MSRKRNYSKKSDNATKIEGKNILEVHLSDKQFDQLIDELSQRCEWSTNRIIEETKHRPQLLVQNKKKDIASSILQIAMAAVFFGVGLCVISTIILNWNLYWTGGAKNVATLCVFFVGVISCACGIDLFFEKDRSYVVSLFSALVALVALIVVLLK